ncbi:MAG: thioredoxin family protein [Candidatus Melainabacteria bacterium]|nr:thioredoxin family protein [Candidatus Melainabacteria bacterium]
MVLLESSELEYGKAIQNFDLPDTSSDRNFSNADLEKDITVVAFICNHCPYVVRIAEDFSALASKTQDFVDWIAISANDPDYREEDSPENMAKFAAKYGFEFPYLFDEEQEVARAFGAVCTPDIFVFKKSSLREAEGDVAISQEPTYRLCYHACFEDLERALNDLKTSDKISFEDKPSAGCSIKWRS